MCRIHTTFRWLLISCWLSVPMVAAQSFSAFPPPGTAPQGERQPAALPETAFDTRYADRLAEPPPPGPENWIPWPLQHQQVDSTDRYRGPGDPLRGTSWLNRPYHVGWMVGCLFGDELISDTVEQRESLWGGYRLGWDFDHYWGLEGRFQFTQAEFTDLRNPSVSRTATERYWDVDLLYYPWGDARWRPYFSLGIGWATIEFRDALNQNFDEVLLTLPVGMGVKYFWQRWLALRISLHDNLAFGNGPLSTMHNVVLTGDVEVHFGGRRLSYFPYHGSVHLW